MSYPEFFLEGLKSAPLTPSVDSVVRMELLTSDLTIEYDGEADFRGVAGKFGVFQEWKVGGDNCTHFPPLLSARFF